MSEIKSIGLILDGNRRYAKKNKLDHKMAYQKGADKAIKIVEHIYKKHKSIKQIFLYTLSYDNLKNRNKTDIKKIFNLVENNMNKLKKLENKNIFFKVIGKLDKLKNYKIYKLIKEINSKYKKNKDKNNNLTVYFCLAYNGRQEIIDAVNKIIKKDIKKVNQTNFKKYLYDEKIIDPEIIIRTSGECRLSDFLLYYSSYSELFFIKKLWPEITTKDVDNIIKKYYKIKRNFGK